MCAAVPILCPVFAGAPLGRHRGNVLQLDGARISGDINMVAAGKIITDELED